MARRSSRSRTSSPRRSAPGTQGISLVTVGFGTTAGTTIPIKAPDGSMTTKKDENGNTVVTQYHPEFLKAAADAAGGTFIDAARPTRRRASSRRSPRLRTQSRASAGRRDEDAALSVVPVSGASFLLLLDTALMERRGRRRVRAAAAQTAAAASCCCCCSLNGCAGLSRTQQAVGAYHERAVRAIRVALPRRDHGGRQDAGNALQLRHGARGWRLDARARPKCLSRVVDSKNDELRFRACSTSVSRISSRGSPRRRDRTTASSTRRSPSTRRRFCCVPTISTRSGTTSSRCERSRAVAAAVAVAAVVEATSRRKGQAPQPQGGLGPATGRATARQRGARRA